MGKGQLRQVSQDQLKKAIQVGQSRQRTHKEDPEKHWPDPKNRRYYAGVVGALGEIVFRDYVRLELADQNPSYWRLDLPRLVCRTRREWANRPPYDLAINGYWVEVKTRSPDAKHTHLLVKTKEFKQVDYYCGVYFTEPMIYYFAGFAVAKELFAGGVQEKFKKAPCYAVERGDLHPLSIWMWFPPHKRIIGFGRI